MRINDRLRLLIVAMFLSIIIMTPLYSLAGNRLDQELFESFEMNARIMSIDLTNGFAVIAEKEIILPFRYEKGIKKFITLIVNQNGTKIDMRKLKKRDRVLVQGVKKKDKLIAVKITLVVE